MHGLFGSDAALQDAISQLALAGFDRADLSVESDASAETTTPELGAENPNTETDAQQQRTLHTGLAASVGALAAAGAVIASGGAAAPAVAAAVAGGVGLGGAMRGVAKASDKMQSEARNEAAERGDLVLAVHLRRPAGSARGGGRNACGGRSKRGAPVLRTGPGRGGRGRLRYPGISYIGPPLGRDPPYGATRGGSRYRKEISGELEIGSGGLAAFHGHVVVTFWPSLRP